MASSTRNLSASSRRSSQGAVWSHCQIRANTPTNPETYTAETAEHAEKSTFFAADSHGLTRIKENPGITDNRPRWVGSVARRERIRETLVLARRSSTLRWFRHCR